MDEWPTRWEPAGWFRRVLAFAIDVVPLTVLVAALFYQFTGFGEAYEAWRAAPRDPGVRLDFLLWRNNVRDVSAVSWVLICLVGEATFLQSSPGKWLLGLKVVDGQGEPLSWGRAAGRNLGKIVSFLPLGLGCLWALWDKRSQTWHDKPVGTHVVRRGR